MPIAVPMMPALGERRVDARGRRRTPRWRPSVARKTPPNLPTSSPSTTTSRSRRISSAEGVVDRLDDVEGRPCPGGRQAALAARVGHARVGRDGRGGAPPAAPAAAAAARRTRPRRASPAPAWPGAPRPPRTAAGHPLARLGRARAPSSSGPSSPRRARWRPQPEDGVPEPPGARPAPAAGRRAGRRRWSGPPPGRSRTRAGWAPPPASARARARAVASYTASRSLPSTRSPWMPVGHRPSGRWSRRRSAAPAAR